MMKRHILKAFIAFAALGMMISCGNVNQNNAEAPTVRVVFEDAAGRTALPSFDYTKFSNITFRKDTTDLWSSSSFNEGENEGTAFQNHVFELAESDVGNSREFSFSATSTTAVTSGEFIVNKVLTYNGSTSVTIHAGENVVTLPIAFSTNSSASGTGNLEYTLDFSTASTKAEVKAALVKLYSFYNDSGSVRDMSNSEKVYGLAETDTYKIQNNKIVYTMDNLSSLVSNNSYTGNYRIEFSLYGDVERTVKLLVWRDNVIIADSLTTSHTESISALNPIYTITKNLCYENKTETQKVSRFTTKNQITAPSEARSGYVFVGWYSDAEYTEVYNGDKPTGNKTIYAKWIAARDGNVYNASKTSFADVYAGLADNTVDTPYTIKFNGVVDDLGAISNVFNYSATTKYVNLDFSEVTQLGSISSYLCSYPAITGISLPANAYLSDNSFYNDSNLKYINIAEGGDYYTGEDGAVYSKDGSRLYYYPAGKTGAYTLPASVKTLNGYAFSANNISSFAVASGNTNFKAINGVLFSASEKELIAYPNGSSANNYQVPLKTVYIRYRAFDPDRLQSKLTNRENNDEFLTFADENLQLKYYYSGYSDVFRYRNNYYNLSSTTSRNIINTNTNYYLYNISFAANAADAPVVQIKTAKNNSVKNGGFTIHSYDGDTSSSTYNQSGWYKLNTVADTQYKITFVDDPYYSNLRDHLSNYVNSDFTVYNAAGTSLRSASGYGEYSFTATGTETYVYIKASSTNYTGTCAFRVTGPEAETTEKTYTVTVLPYTQEDDPKYDFTLNNYLSERDPYIYFYVLNGTGNYKWFVDNVYANATGSGYNLYVKNYEKGVHTVTLERTINGVQYSYSKQIKIE